MESITIVSSLPPIKGITPYTLGFVKELEKYMHVTVLGFKNLYPDFLYKRISGSSSKDDGIKLPNLENTTIHQILDWYNPLTWIIAGFLAKGKTLHIQYWIWVTVPMYLTIIFIARYIKRMQVVITVHNVLPHEKGKMKMFFDRVLYFFSDKYIVHSYDNKEQLLKILGAGNTPSIEVIPHGIIVPNSPLVSRDIAREKYKISVDKKVLLSFGNIRDYKGLDILLLSLVDLIKEDSSYCLIIAGSCWEDWNKYQSIIDKYVLSDYILRIDGFISDAEVSYVFGASDLMILPYRHFDAQSGVLALNFYYSLPVIVSNQGGLVEVVDNGDLIFESENINDLVKKISYSFNNNTLAEKKIYLKKRSKMFGWNVIAKKSISYYNFSN